MHKDICIAIAQTKPVAGDVSANLLSHIKLIEIAGNSGADLIIFPELSLTGYELQLAEKFALSASDPRLDEIADLSRKLKMIIIVGCPLKDESGLKIASFILHPDSPLEVYTKHHLHSGEEKYFTPGKNNSVIKFNDEIISLAICADICHPVHAENAAKARSSIYLTSVLITDGGYKTDTDFLKSYAKDYKMTVMMSNYGGPSGGYEAAGRSGVWNSSGQLLAEASKSDEGLIIAKKIKGEWETAYILR